MHYIALQQELSITALPHKLEQHEVQQWLYLGEDSDWRVQAEVAIKDTASRALIADLLDNWSQFQARASEFDLSLDLADV